MGRRILAIDPSGNFQEGKGTTGYVLIDLHDNNNYDIIEIGDIRADKFSNRLDYWSEHVKLLNPKNFDFLVMEDFRLYNHPGMSAATQSGSLMETPRLLGLLEHTCHILKKPYVLQMASMLKPFSDSILVELGILDKVGKHYYLKDKATNDHIRSAFKHFLVWHSKEKK